MKGIKDFMANENGRNHRRTGTSNTNARKRNKEITSNR